MSGPGLVVIPGVSSGSGAPTAQASLTKVHRE